MNRKTLIVIVGPTAVGKTAFAIDLAAKLKTEIISADSRQIYKELKIGTAKPTLAELTNIRHHLINTHTLEETFNAAEFGEVAFKLCEEIFLSCNQVIVCGGSGLYLKGLLEGFDEIPGVGEAIRSAVIKEYESHGLGWLQQQVQQLDPTYYDQVDKQNPQRLVRALEVMRTTGKPFSHWHKKQKKQLPFVVLKVGLEKERQQLYERIDKRMDAMIDAGLFEEAEMLYPKRNLNALQTVGYQEIFGWMDGMYDRNEAIRLLKRNSRQYAKRQLTWFKRDKEITWFNDADSAMNYVLTKLEDKVGE